MSFPHTCVIASLVSPKIAILSALTKMFMFEFHNTIPSILYVSQITFSSIKLNNIGDSESPCLRLVFSVAGPDIYDATFI